jgi:hypothetical protein
MTDERVPAPSIAFRVKWAGIANNVARLSGRPGAPTLDPQSESETIASWLQWNDANGSHTAELAEAEGFEPYDIGTAWDVLATMLMDEDDTAGGGQ